jgi:hypothetical protein
MSVELKRQLDVAVAKQSLHGFWIGSDTDEKRRETVAQIMKTESLWVVIDQRSSEVRRSGSRSVGSCSAIVSFFSSFGNTSTPMSYSFGESLRH